EEGLDTGERLERSNVPAKMDHVEPCAFGRRRTEYRADALEVRALVVQVRGRDEAHARTPAEEDRQRRSPFSAERAARVKEDRPRHAGSRRSCAIERPM